MFKRFVTSLAIPLTLGACATAPYPEIRAVQTTNATPYTRGIVSAADPRAAAAGVEMLRKGGSATDAAIAIMLSLTVVEPQSSGLGGGGFYVHTDPNGNLDTIDGREKAPAAATPNRFLKPDGEPMDFRTAVESGLSIGVPGSLRVAEEAMRKHGKLPWATVLEPAIRLARDGFQITPRLYSTLLESKSTAGRTPEGLALFYQADGTPKPIGTLVRNPALAETLQQIALHGADWLYTGQNAEDLARTIANDTPSDGKMTAADIESYKVADRPAVCGTYRAYRVCGMAPPSSGATTVLAILGELEPFDLAKLGPKSPTFWHLFAEAQRLAYADRERFLADPDFVPVPVKELTDHAYLLKRGALISPTSTMTDVEPGLPLPPPAGKGPAEHGTSHFVVVDKWGDAVSYTSTIESSFGSGDMFRGFYLNNELTDFSFVPQESCADRKGGGSEARMGDIADGKLEMAVGHDCRPVANRVEGGKRPRSSMSPTLVFSPDGKLLMAVGAAGGATIPVQTTRAIIGVIDFHLPVDQALALPMLFSPGGQVAIEPNTWLAGYVPELEALGHKDVKVRQLPLKANAALLTAQGWTGAGDPRSEGVAILQ
ncbi:gamma-glutamyltransferase [Tsuneonella mangrovi]|uniref:gamma-glutamyltransferase n=1 Tax=Tsuneonella mangrovi TaxID=1982042 RepID=UPI000BA23224|nr:gamma-glutamyltransferase [Tsuneonella mangrovi]